MRTDREKDSLLEGQCLYYLNSIDSDEKDRLCADLAGKREKVIYPLISAVVEKRRQARSEIINLGYSLDGFDDNRDLEARKLLQPVIRDASRVFLQIAENNWKHDIGLLGFSKRNEKLDATITSIFDKSQEQIWVASLMIGEATLLSIEDPKPHKLPLLNGIENIRLYAAKLSTSDDEITKRQGVVLATLLNATVQFHGAPIAQDMMSKTAERANLDPETLEEIIMTRTYGYFMRLQ